MQQNTTNNNNLFKSITMRFYAELNDFLPEDKKFEAFEVNLKMPAVVSEVITSMGVPLSEVDLILLNGKPAPRNQKLSVNDYVSVYPTFESFDIGDLRTTQTEALRKTTFVADAHLGKLTKYLRMLGFDTLYRNDFGDDEIINLSLSEKRIILTRDKNLLNSSLVTHAYYIRATDKHQQLVEVVDKFDLRSQFKPFTRCMTCNACLMLKTPEEVLKMVDNNILQSYREFYLCPTCNKVFWEGSHFKRMERMVLKIAGRTRT